MGRISNFKSLPEVIALAEIPVRTYNPDEIKDSLSVVLNGIQDPGNIGTILRVCDWFGIQIYFVTTIVQTFLTRNPFKQAWVQYSG